MDWQQLILDRADLSLVPPLLRGPPAAVCERQYHVVSRPQPPRGQRHGGGDRHEVVMV
jgi:hypothetical protein